MNTYTDAVSADIAWDHLLHDICTFGEKTAPRGMPITEIIGNQVIVDMQHPVITCVERKLSYTFMLAEAWWILSGKKDVPSIEKYCKVITKFSDDGLTFFGAYGPPISEQLDYVVDCLKGDRDSRQAVLTIWRQNPQRSKDIPCTVAVQWVIRDGHLHCIDTMRSNDAWLGFPYDVFNFSMLSWHVLEQLRRLSEYRDLKLGALFLQAGSHHLYDRDMIKYQQLKQTNRLRHNFGGVAGHALSASSVVDQLAFALGEPVPAGTQSGSFFWFFNNQLRNS